jgi:hypothetical protein
VAKQPPTGGQGGNAPNRSDLRLVRQALRNDWAVPPATKGRILKRLISYLDIRTEEGATARDRTVIMAARTLAAFCGLTLKQQALDLHRQRLEGVKADVSLADLVGEAERRAEERTATRDTTQ